MGEGEGFRAATFLYSKKQNNVGFKKELTDPHKQALSFMASVTPSLLKSDVQVHT